MYEIEASPEPDQNATGFQRFEEINDEYWKAVKNVLVPKISEFNISVDQLKTALQDSFIFEGGCRLFIVQAESNFNCE